MLRISICEVNLKLSSLALIAMPDTLLEFKILLVELHEINTLQKLYHASMILIFYKFSNTAFVCTYCFSSPFTADSKSAEIEESLCCF